MAPQRTELLALRHIPEHRGVVEERREHGPVRAEGQSVRPGWRPITIATFGRCDRHQNDFGVFRVGQAIARPGGDRRASP